MMNIGSKSWSVLMMPMIRAKNIAGESSGSVIFQNCCHLEAPSMLDAS